MKVSINWLKDYISPGISTEQLAHKLTMAGLEVETMENVGDDTVFELEITPNRNDCLSILGIAREVSAIVNKKINIIKQLVVKYPNKRFDIKIDDKKACLRYIGTFIKDVKIAPSSKWIKKRIGALGLRPINNIVDVTNFVLMETGQPLHAFDYDKLEGGKIIVRWAKKGEKIVTIDGEEHKLDPSILVIADAKRPVAIAGIMGGLDTEVTSKTKNILLESAYFDPILIRRTSIKLGLSSDSSYRFERDVDYDIVKVASHRAIGLILKEAKGNIVEHVDDVAQKSPQKTTTVTIAVDKINNYLGSSITSVQCINILNKLAFKVKKGTGDVLTITAPAFRDDIKSDVDIIEEVARIIGYDQLPLDLPRITATDIVENLRISLRSKIRNALTGLGFNEIITYTMINQEMLNKSLQGTLKGSAIANPLTQDQEMMRPALLPSFLLVATNNINRGQTNFRFFECGKIYNKGMEQEVLGVIVAGTSNKDWRRLQSRKDDFFDVKGAFEAVLQKLNISGASFESCHEPFLESGEASVVRLRGKEIGSIGKISVEVLNNWNIKQGEMYFAQILLEDIFKVAKGPDEFQSISDFPIVGRDVSLAVNKNVQFAQIEALAKQLGGNILIAIDFKEEYLGDKIPNGQKGLVFSLTYKSTKRTLTEEEVDKVHKPIEEAFIDQLGAIRR